MGTGRIVFSFKLLPASEITALPDGYIFAKSVAEATVAAIAVAAATTFYNWAYPVLEQNAEGLSLGKNTSLTITSTAILEILLIAGLILAV